VKVIDLGPCDEFFRIFLKQQIQKYLFHIHQVPSMMLLFPNIPTRTACASNDRKKVKSIDGKNMQIERLYRSFLAHKKVTTDANAVKMSK